MWLPNETLDSNSAPAADRDFVFSLAIGQPTSEVTAAAADTVTRRTAVPAVIRAHRATRVRRVIALVRRATVSVPEAVRVAPAIVHPLHRPEAAVKNPVEQRQSYSSGSSSDDSNHRSHSSGKSYGSGAGSGFSASSKRNSSSGSGSSRSSGSSSSASDDFSYDTVLRAMQQSKRARTHLYALQRIAESATDPGQFSERTADYSSDILDPRVSRHSLYPGYGHAFYTASSRAKYFSYLLYAWSCASVILQQLVLVVVARSIVG